MTEATASPAARAQHDPSRAVGDGCSVLVTGASGVIGRVVVPALVEAGLRVVAADRTESGASPAERVLVGDTRDEAFVTDALHALGDPVDAVVHLAAIASPGQVSEVETLLQNVAGAYTVLDGAGRAGVRAAVAASSFSAYGYPWAGTDLSPAYVPVDETQAPVTIDSYGLSKLVLEDVGAFATRRWGMPTTLLRLPFVGDSERLADYLTTIRADVAGGRRELWTWLDTRDAARAVLAVLRSGLTGHHVLNVAAPDTVTEVPTSELLARYHPTTEVRRPLGTHGSVIDTTLARDLLGFEAVHGWRGTTATHPTTARTAS